MSVAIDRRHGRHDAEKNDMTKRHHDEPRDGDEAIWRDAITLSPADTKDARIHVTLRLDPSVYRAVLAERKAHHARLARANDAQQSMGAF